MSRNPVLWMDTSEELPPLSALAQLLRAVDGLLNPVDEAGNPLKREGHAADFAATSIGALLLPLIHAASEAADGEEEERGLFDTIAYNSMHRETLPGCGPTDFQGTARRAFGVCAAIFKLFGRFQRDCFRQAQRCDYATAALYAGCARMDGYHRIILRTNVTSLRLVTETDNAP